MDSKWPDWLAINENLRELSPYGAPQIPAEVRLNTNENPFSLEAELQSAIMTEISEQVAHLNRYPDRDAVELRKLLAAYVNESSKTNLTLENIWAANGSNEILQSISLAFQGAAMGFEPSYSMHPLISKTVGKSWISIPRSKDFTFEIDVATAAIKQHRPGLIFLTTPNNPTGDSISLSDIAQVANAALEVNAIVIVDEAYAEFSKGQSAVLLLPNHPNLIISRTMSKAFAFAGARLGYMIASKIMVEAMLLVRLPYHLSDLTQAAARAALRNRASLQREVEQLKINRDKVISQLRDLQLTVIESDANFILFSNFGMQASELWKALVDKGVLIRDVGIPDHLRVTVGTAAENERFILALHQALEA
jgi:histidinol-phosphate aminotransferase